MSEKNYSAVITQKYAFYLMVLLGVLCLNVIAQFIQKYFPLPFLPPFSAWRSSALAYPQSLLVQERVLIVFGCIIYKMLLNKSKLQYFFGYCLLIIISLYTFYFFWFKGQLITELFFARDTSWWSTAISVFFDFIVFGCIAYLLADKPKPHYSFGRGLLVTISLCSLYLFWIESRVISELVLAKDSTWLNVTILALLDWVVVAFFLIWAHYHWKYGKKQSKQLVHQP